MNEVDAIKAAGKVQLALEQPILNKFFEGEFRAFEQAPYEKSRVIAVFDVKLPLEAITLLASAGNPVQAKLLWRPSLLTSYPFQGSMALAVVGCIGMFASGLRRAKDDMPSIAQLEDDVLGARLRETAQRFHTLLRQGSPEDDPDFVRTVIRLAERLGKPALRALQEEIVFDDEFELALRQWSRHSYDPALIEVLDQVRTSPSQWRYDAHACREPACWRVQGEAPELSSVDRQPPGGHYLPLRPRPQLHPTLDHSGGPFLC
ncbi:hypothetical protein ACFQU7_40610 [Pseudoroseomonas wenyumeiae]